MKKNIFLLGLSAILITACGTNSKPDAGELPPSESGITLSISCFDGGQGLEGAFIANCYVHAVDKYSKPVAGLSFDVALVNGPKVQEIGTGKIYSNTPITFFDNILNFLQEDVTTRDTLIIVPSAEANDVTYVGNWEIGAVNSNLALVENSVNLETTNGLSYVIGGETRYDLGISASAHIEYPRAIDLPQEPDKLIGFTHFNIIYDPELSGEIIYVGAHTTGNRIGTATTILLGSDSEI